MRNILKGISLLTILAAGSGLHAEGYWTGGFLLGARIPVTTELKNSDGVKIDPTVMKDAKAPEFGIFVQRGYARRWATRLEFSYSKANNVGSATFKKGTTDSWVPEKSPIDITRTNLSLQQTFDVITGIGKSLYLIGGIVSESVESKMKDSFGEDGNYVGVLPPANGADFHTIHAVGGNIGVGVRWHFGKRFRIAPEFLTGSVGGQTVSRVRIVLAF